MAVPSVQSNSTAIPAQTNTSQTTWDLMRVATIALPIIASLASLFLLPLEMAIALTAVVTIGAIVYHNRSNAPVVAPIQSPKIQAPSKISHRYRLESMEGTKGRSVLSMVFQSPEEGAEFCKQHGAQFADCKIERSKDPKWPEIRIIPKENKDSQDVLKRLVKIFPGIGVEE